MTVDLTATPLKSGSHPPGSDEACWMEAISVATGETWSDHPSCVSPVIAVFGRRWNDALPSDDDRDRLLRPLTAVVVGTAPATAEVEGRRAWMAFDWLVRFHLAAWLDLAEIPHSLRTLPEIEDRAGLDAALTVIHKARGDAAAARAAAWAAARAAARAAAWAAARDAAGAAAWDAAGAAARAAAWDKLAPTVTTLQQSAQDLVRRMCEVGR